MNVATRRFAGMELLEVTIADERDATLALVKFGKRYPVGLLSYDKSRKVYVFDIYVDGPFTLEVK
jgi:hypothetical protein